MEHRKLIKAEMAKHKKSATSSSSLLSKVKKAESSIHHELDTPLWHYGIRIGLVIHILLTKQMPDSWVMLSKQMGVRVLFAAVIVYMAYVDIISAALLAVAFVLLVQESQSRSAAALLVAGSSSLVTAASDKEKLHLSVGMGQKAAGPGDNSQIGLSSYGSPDEVINIAGPHEYVSQVGTLGITQDMAGGKLNLVADAEEPGTKYVKVNMGQGMNSVVYDMPASKTLTENLEEAQTGFITAKNLLDAQINGAQGADTNVECAVESISGSYNAQGLGIPMAFAHDNCVYSKVN
jgi:hypothetical protein